MALDDDDAKLTIAEFERKHGIAEDHSDYPRRYAGYPPSHYYVDEEPDYGASHRRADAALARLARIASSWKT